MKDTASLFFVHIPKTAGTSFRKGAESYFGKDRICYDYSLSSVKTADLVRELVYNKGDFLAFQQAYNNEKYKMLSGHLSAVKYIYGMGALNTITFLRNPVHRIISEYRHHIRHNEYVGSLETFYKSPQFINRQYKLLRRVPLPAIGLLGLTERYEESLTQINARFGVRIPNLQLNVGEKLAEEDYLPDAESLAELKRLNALEFKLYKRAGRLFKVRMSIFKAGLPFVHGMMQQFTATGLSGWAWWAESESPVNIKVYINDVLSGECLAKDLCPGILRLAPPRQGYVGFNCGFRAVPGDKIRCEVAETGQVLGEDIVRAPGA